MSERLLRAESLSVARGGREIVHGVSLTLHRGELVALLGPNGAGKSTLLAALAGSLAPNAGKLTRHGRVALALQSPDLARRSVLANLTVALAWWGVPRAQRADRARTALATLGIAHLANRGAEALSGGERRRVHLARALAGLDAETRGELLADAAGVLRDPARATLVVLHDRAEAWALADRLLVLIDGRLLADGTPAALLAAPPSPQVARFLGYDGEILEGGMRRLTRPVDVTLDPAGPLAATVGRVTPTEDGARLVLDLPDGRLLAHVTGVAPRTGDHVRVALRGGVRFPA